MNTKVNGNAKNITNQELKNYSLENGANNNCFVASLVCCVTSNIAFSFLLNHRRNTGSVSLEQQRFFI